MGLNIPCWQFIQMFHNTWKKSSTLLKAEPGNDNIFLIRELQNDFLVLQFCRNRLRNKGLLEVDLWLGSLKIAGFLMKCILYTKQALYRVSKVMQLLKPPPRYKHIPWHWRCTFRLQKTTEGLTRVHNNGHTIATIMAANWNASPEGCFIHKR